MFLFDVSIFEWYTSVLIKGGFGKYRLYDMKLMLHMKEEWALAFVLVVLNWLGIEMVGKKFKH